jgi:hypothetical protein
MSEKVSEKPNLNDFLKEIEQIGIDDAIALPMGDYSDDYSNDYLI